MRAWLLSPLLFGLAWASGAADGGWNRQLEIGRSLAGQGRFQEALDALAQARSQATAAGSSHDEAIALNDLGAIYLQLHDSYAAERCLRRSITIWGSRGDQDALAPRVNLAQIYIYRGQYRAAEALLKETDRLADRNLGPDHPVTAAILISLAEVAFDLHEVQRAATLCSQALALLRKRGDSYDLASVIESLGAVYLSRGKSTRRPACLGKLVRFWKDFTLPTTLPGSWPSRIRVGSSSPAGITRRHKSTSSEHSHSPRRRLDPGTLRSHVYSTRTPWCFEKPGTNRRPKS